MKYPLCQNKKYQLKVFIPMIIQNTSKQKITIQKLENLTHFLKTLVNTIPRTKQPSYNRRF